MNENTWFGSDVSPKDSLFENGLLMKRKGKGFYEVIVQIGDAYAYGSFWLDSWLEDMTDAEWKELCSLVGMSVDEYKDNLSEMPDDDKAATLATDLMGMVDYSTLFGWTSWEPEYYTESQIKSRLDKAIAA
jgi:hypothetical protein